MSIDKIWNDSGDNFVLGYHAQLPLGYRSKDDPSVSNRKCPRCGTNKLTGAIIWRPEGSQTIEGSDEADPNILCTACGYWDDSMLQLTLSFSED